MSASDEQAKETADKEIKHLIIGYAGFQFAVLVFALSEHADVIYYKEASVALSASIPLTIFYVGFRGAHGISTTLFFLAHHVGALTGLSLVLLSYYSPAFYTFLGCTVGGLIYFVIWSRIRKARMRKMLDHLNNQTTK
jgi:uncharacterized membrane protein YccC